MHSVPQCPFLLATCFIAHTLSRRTLHCCQHPPTPPQSCCQNSSRRDIFGIYSFSPSSPELRPAVYERRVFWLYTTTSALTSAVADGSTEVRPTAGQAWARQKSRVAGCCTAAVIREGDTFTTKLRSYISQQHNNFLLFNPLKPSGHYMSRQFNIQQFYVQPTQCIMCFVWIWEQTAIISPYNMNWLVCITETECVYCAVRTESLNVTQFNLPL
jgi:hypothetical protein